MREVRSQAGPRRIVVGAALLAAAVLAGCASKLPEPKRTFVDPPSGTAPGSTAASPTSVVVGGGASSTTATSPATDGGASTTSSPTPTSTTTAPTTVPRTTTVLRPTTTASNPDKAKAQAIGQALIDAWAANDRVAAAKVATPDALATLFARPYGGPFTFEQCSGGVGNYLCNYDADSGALVVQLFIAHEAGVPMVVRGVNFAG